MASEPVVTENRGWTADREASEYEPGRFGVFFDGPNGIGHLSLDVSHGTFAIGKPGGPDYFGGIPLVAVRVILAALSPDPRAEAAIRLAEAVVAREWFTVVVTNPAPHQRYAVIRDGRIFTATPCYGMHPAWWVVTTMEGEAPPVPMNPDDRFMALDDFLAVEAACRQARSLPAPSDPTEKPDG